MGLNCSVAGLELANPVLVASGTFGYGEELADLTAVDRIGGICTKAITLAPRLGNPTPRVAETPAGMLNAIGLANVGVDAFIRDKLPFLRACAAKVIVNVAGSLVEDYCAVVDRLEDAEGIDAYELNISCPNVKHGGIAFGADPQAIERMVGAIKDRASRPLIVKMSPNVTDIATTSKAAEDAGADALSLINTLIGMAVDVRRRRPLLANITGGLSGPAIRPVALHMVYKVFQAVRIPIIGIGGIMERDDALAFLMCGARAIQIGTATFVDPDTPVQIVDALAAWCEHEGIEDLSDIVGACHL